MKKINILIICLLIILLTGCGKEKKNDTNNTEVGNNITITLEEYNKIKSGMSYSEVKEIIGGDCNNIPSDSEEEIYICSGRMAGTNATITFENDKVKTKTQTGLE